MNAERVALYEQTKGWLYRGDGEALERYGLLAPGPIVELGSYCGKSTLWLGSAGEAAQLPVWAIDWHRGSPEMNEGADCHDPDVVGPDGHDTLPWLRRTLAAAGLEDVVIPVVSRTETAGRAWASPIGLLFIDACHDDRVLTDYRLWAPGVVDGGYLLFHDSAIGPIAHTILVAQDEGFEVVELVDDITVLQRRRGAGC